MLRVERSTDHGSRLITTDPFAAGQVIARITAFQQAARPTYRSIQIGPEAHVDDIGILRYLNHSCQPNCTIDTTTLSLVAGRDILADEELTFFYPSTEWDMDRPFRCLCGAPECIGVVSGAKDLPWETLRPYPLAPHIQRLVDADRDGRGSPRSRHRPPPGGSALPAPDQETGALR
jgi:hypothetical protein